MRNKRKVFSTFALGIMCANILTSIPQLTYAETTETNTTAVDRRQAVLSFAQSERAYEFKSEDPDEWQMLGTFMSNYFVPYESYLTTVKVPKYL